MLVIIVICRYMAKIAHHLLHDIIYVRIGQYIRMYMLYLFICSNMHCDVKTRSSG